MQGGLPRGIRERRLALALLGSFVALLLGCGATPTVLPEVVSNPTASVTRQAVAAAPTPTWTVAPTVSATPTATATATPPPTPLPPPPGNSPGLSGLGIAAADYLTRAGGNVVALEAALAKWGLVSSKQGPVPSLSAQAIGPVVVADLSGQGSDDVVVAAADTQAGGSLPEGTLLILHNDGGVYHVVFDSAAAGQTRGPVSIVSTQDLTGDARADVTYAIQSCGASTCFAELHLLTCRNGEYEDIAGTIAVAFPDRIEVREANGGRELVVHGNTYGSVGAGPQRAQTLIYRVQGGRLTLAETSYDASDLLYFKVLDANAALAAGRLDDAIGLYNQAISDGALKASAMMMNGMDAAQEIEALKSFARFRLVVAYAIRGDEVAASKAVAQAQSAGGPFAPVAAAFWGAYSQSKSVDQGCVAVQASAEANPDLLGILNAFGYANPEFAAPDLCRGAGTAPHP